MEAHAEAPESSLYPCCWEEEDCLENEDDLHWSSYWEAIEEVEEQDRLLELEDRMYMEDSCYDDYYDRYDERDEDWATDNSLRTQGASSVPGTTVEDAFLKAMG